MLAAILTIGNELTSGDTPNTNGAWIAGRLEPLGVRVVLIAAVPDEIDRIAEWVRREAPLVDHVFVTGGLGGTPDDITREAVAAAFGVGQTEVPDLADRLRVRFPRDPEYAARWARLPDGAEPLENPLGGAPGFAIGNVWVLPGLPAEMEAMFDSIGGRLGAAEPFATWRRTYRTTEGRIVGVLQEAAERHPTVLVGSYPTFHPQGGEVEIVLKSRDADAVAEAAGFVTAAVARLV